MPNHGWKQLLAGAAALRAPGKYPIEAYSEFMPPPRLGVKAYSGVDSQICEEADPWGWHVTEYEEAFELEPGLALLGANSCTSCITWGGASRPTASRRASSPAIRIGRRSCTTPGAPRTSATCCSRRWPFRALRMTKDACAGRCSAGASKDRAARFGEAFSARHRKNCRITGVPISSADC